MGSVAVTRECIRKQWLECRRHTYGAPTVRFVCIDMNAVCIDGFWTSERDSFMEHGLLGDRQIMLKGIWQSAPEGAVLFPEQSQGLDYESRAFWYFRRSLFRRTSSKYSFNALEDALSKLVHVEIGASGSKAEETTIIDRCFDLLSRLPETVPIPKDIVTPPGPEDNGPRSWQDAAPQEWSWESLEIARNIPVIVVRMALVISATWDKSVQAIRGRNELVEFPKFINKVSELLDSTIYEMEKASGKCQAWRWFVLKSYLWNTWQRCVSLHHW